jgi:protein SCO1/2
LAPNGDWVRTAVASLAICVAGGALLWHGTEGFRALTTEAARRRAIAASPRPIPVVQLEDQDGHLFTLDRYVGRPVVVDFVYTGCGTICPLLSDGFRRLDRAARSATRGSSEQRLQLVSITFDSLDTPARLREYASHYAADGRSWRFARVRERNDLDSLLRAFGIVVISDGRGGFQHNAAVHVLDDRGRLARVLDVGASPDEVARAVTGASR